MRTRIGRWGDRLVVRLPHALARELALADGVAVEVGIDDGKLVLRPTAAEAPSLADLLVGITPGNLPDHGFDDWPVGREAL